MAPESPIAHFEFVAGPQRGFERRHTGDAAQIAGYLGKSDVFDEAVADFSVAYADQTEKDHDVLVKAVRDGRLEVFVEGM